MSACLRVSIKTVFPGNCSRKMLSSQLIPPKQWHFLPPLFPGARGRQAAAATGGSMLDGPKVRGAKVGQWRFPRLL